jgi:uncharacterized protein (TIGR01777 family)
VAVSEPGRDGYDWRVRIAVAGSSGLIGSALVPGLVAAGHEVVRLVRRDAAAPDELRWTPDAGLLDADALGPVDAFVNLAGATIDARWTATRKRDVLNSRVLTTRLLAETAAAADNRPALVSASAMGIYGYDRGDEELTEESSHGTGFLAGVLEAWEAAADPAREAGSRVVHMRTSHVLSRRGGLLGRMLLPFRLGAGGRIGSGRQWWSWIEIDDAVAGYRFALEGDVEGPVNLASPNPVTNAEFTEALGRALHRPTLLPTPKPALWAMFGGEAMREAVYAGARLVPARLQAGGFDWQEPELDAALRRALAH